MVFKHAKTHYANVFERCEYVYMCVRVCECVRPTQSQTGKAGRGMACGTSRNVSDHPATTAPSNWKPDLWTLSIWSDRTVAQARAYKWLRSWWVGKTPADVRERRAVLTYLLDSEQQLIILTPLKTTIAFLQLHDGVSTCVWVSSRERPDHYLLNGRGGKIRWTIYHRRWFFPARCLFGYWKLLWHPL